jgi:hypothetical protein
MRIEITARDDLFSLEDKLVLCSKPSRDREIEVRLARNLRPDFFGESRIAAILLTLGLKNKLIVRDWHHSWVDSEIEEHFRTSLVGIAAVFAAYKVKNDVGVPFPDSSKSLLEGVAVRGGILEPRHSGARGTSISFCAFDPDWSDPAAFAGYLKSTETFKPFLAKYRRTYLEVGKGVRHSVETRRADDELGTFAAELLQNAIKHGRYSDSGSMVRGMRSLRMRKHVDTKTHFLKRAEGFKELSDYLSAVVPDNESFKFYELAISDSGMGMLGHFVYKRPEFAAAIGTPLEKVALVNRLLTQSLSSTPDFPGAGHGLPNALAAISRLGGFVSLRTDRLWLCGHHAQEGLPLEAAGLRPVGCKGEFAPIIGTHFNILLPIRVG